MWYDVPDIRESLMYLFAVWNCLRYRRYLGFPVCYLCYRFYHFDSINDHSAKFKSFSVSWGHDQFFVGEDVMILLSIIIWCYLFLALWLALVPTEYYIFVCLWIYIQNAWGKHQSIGNNGMKWANYVISMLQWYHYYFITSLSNHLAGMHFEYAETSFEDVGRNVEDFCYK